MLDYISSDTFRNFSNYKIDLYKGNKVSLDILKSNAIIYCKIDFLLPLFKTLECSGRKYILITHSADFTIDEDIFKKRPKCIVKWFGINAWYDHPDLIPIPIGLFPQQDQVWADNIKWLCENVGELKQELKDLKTLYCNWNPANTTRRTNTLLYLQQSHMNYIWDRKSANEKIGDWDKNLGFKEYCNNMSKHKFIVSPPGRGIDCHRTWEALYMGSFPIVIKHNIYKEYSDLPIIQVKNYRELSYELLYSYLDKEYNYEKITMEYWKNRINNEFNKL